MGRTTQRRFLMIRPAVAGVTAIVSVVGAIGLGLRAGGDAISRYPSGLPLAYAGAPAGSFQPLRPSALGPGVVRAGTTSRRADRPACAGARQTIDPLSPVCIPTWSGDNGGATAPGVTAGRVDVVLYNTFGVEGDLTTPYDPSQEATGSQAGATKDLVKTMKAYVRYFNARFQTYGRTVRVVAHAGNPAASAAQIAGDVREIAMRHHPFAIAAAGSMSDYLFRAAASAELLAFRGERAHVAESVLRDAAPYGWSLHPTRETVADLSAAFLCRKIIGGRARFSTDPTLRGALRRIGLVYESPSPREPGSDQLADVLRAALRARCGFDFDAVAPLPNKAEASTVMLGMKTKAITTLVCVCVPVQPENTVTILQAAATTLAYRPEWYFDPFSHMDRPTWASLYQRSDHVAFGSTTLWLHLPPHHQFHARAYRSVVRDDGAPNARYGAEIYQVLQQVFAAIQNAGPVLTVPNVESGMRTYAQRDADVVLAPVGGYERSQAFVDTGAAWWWDPTGTPPGGRAGEGCIRLARGGRMTPADGWSDGDDDLFADGTCTADARQLI